MGAELILALVGAASGVMQRVNAGGGFDQAGKDILVDMLHNLAVDAGAGKEMRAKFEAMSDEEVDDFLTE